MILKQLYKLQEEDTRIYFSKEFFSKFSFVDKEKMAEVLSIILHAKTPYNAKQVYIVLESTSFEKWDSELIEIFNFISNCEENLSEFLSILIKERNFYLAKQFINKLESTDKVKNINMVYDLIVTREYENSKTPIESLVKILKSENESAHFAEVYKDDIISAMSGVKDLEEEFPNIDIQPATYVMVRKKYRT